MNINTHNEAFMRFCKQPIGRAKLVLIDYANTHTDADGRRQLRSYFGVASELSIRNFAAMVSTTKPNTSDFEHLISVKLNLAKAVY